MSKAKQLLTGLGPAGVKRFPYVGQVTSTVRNKASGMTQNNRDFNLALAIAQTVQKEGTVNTTDAMQGHKDHMHSHHMPLHLVVRSLRRQDTGELKRLSFKRVQLLIDKCAHLAPATWAVAGPLPSSENTEADRGLVVQQSIDACVSIERLRQKARIADVQKYLPRLEHAREARLGSAMGQAEMRELDESIAELARQWRPSESNIREVNGLVSRIEGLARLANPKAYVVARLFGSRSYGLCADHSDVDISVTVSPPIKGRDFFRSLVAILRRASGFVQVIDVSHAKVPIIKFVYMTRTGLRLEGDVSLNGSKGLAKSRLVSTYLRLDPRVRQVLAALKMWAMRRDITSNTTLNSFGLLMMGLAFLIGRRVVPPLQLLATGQVSAQAWARLTRIQHSPFRIAGLYPKYLQPSLAENADTAADITAAAAGEALGTARCLQSGRDLPEWPVEGTRAYYLNSGGELGRWHSPNRDSAAVLLFDMFQYYGFEFRPRDHAISPRLGSPAIPRSSLPHLAPPVSAMPAVAGEPNKWRNALRLLAIEDPFDLTVNCGRSAPPEWVEGLLWEMRRAAWCLLPPGKRHSPLDRLLLPPSESVFCDPGVWASAYHRALPEHLAPHFDPGVDGVPERTIDLERLESAQLAGLPPAVPLSVQRPQPGQMRQTF
ncbi:hypothetical protein GGI20_004575 [Coemansia sp. BCRC 34301]|nr:hypothetical protein GGI20_004575 [Coemansia sp. BCRC 34301]